ncbi:hypothetical protein ACYA5R_22870 [Klebsiella pneumoniae]|uniref:hypothetical protein n=1 Tax=Klebsiella pneumoniae TaxID=573 RepID=UPI001CBE4801|nr:hypothetical protein [Klebsiella pneumoniae]
MWNPATSTSIEEVVTEANNLNELLDLMHICFKKNEPSSDRSIAGVGAKYRIKYFCLDRGRGEAP